MTLRVSQERSFVGVYALLLLGSALALRALLSRSFTEAEGVGLTVVLGIGLVAFWAEWRRARRWVEIDAAAAQVRVHSLSLLLKSKVVDYPLSDFVFVRSYISGLERRSNVVELVTRTQEGLELASFKPSYKRPRALQLHSLDGESEQAQMLRKQVAAHTSIRDLGCLGRRAVGAQLKS